MSAWYARYPMSSSARPRSSRRIRCMIAGFSLFSDGRILMDKRLLAKAIQTKREDNLPHFEVINCTHHGFDTPEGKDRLEKLKAEAEADR